MRAWCPRFVLRADEIGLVAKLTFGMADTGIDPGKFSAWRNTGWPWLIIIGGANCRIHRDIVDADLDRAGSVRKSVDAVDPYGALVKDLWPDRMRKSRCGPSAGDSLLLASAAVHARAFAPGEFTKGATRSRAIVSRRCVYRERLQGSARKARLGRAWSTIWHGDIAVNFEELTIATSRQLARCMQNQQD